MKINFITASKADQDTKDQMLKLAEMLRKGGHAVVTTRLEAEFSSKPKYDEKELNQYHKKMMNNIKQADVVIAEISTKSSGLGYEIAVSLNERKPILALYSGPAEKNSSLSLKSNPSKLIQVKKYDEDNLNEIVNNFLEDARNKIDTKFILIISPEIDKYISWAADTRRMHKAQVVRNAIEDTMEKDEEYQKFLKDNDIN